MKKIKYFLLMVFSICATMCFTSHALADEDVSCHYTISHPFQDYSNSDVTATQYNYLQYIYFRKLGKGTEDFINYLEYFRKHIPINGKAATYEGEVNANSIELYLRPFNSSVSYVNSGKKVKGVAFNTESEVDFYINNCPDLVALPKLVYQYNFSMTSSKGQHISNVKIYNLENNNVDDLIVKIFQDYSNDDAPLIFMRNELKIATGGIMYLNSAYNIHFNDTHEERNINPIVDKYLKINGLKDVIINLTESLETGKYDKIDVEILSNIPDFDVIDDELKILRNFNDVGTGYKGLRDKLNKFLIESGVNMSVTSWFEKYAPDSQAQYVDGLIYLLNFAKNNRNIYEAQKDAENTKKNVTECADDDKECIKNSCSIGEKARVQVYCTSKYGSNSTSVNECQKSLSTSEKIEESCKNKTKEEIIDDAENTIDDSKKILDDKFDGYITNIFENIGVDIGEKDFCQLLLGDIDDNGKKIKGIYYYIRLVVNIIRIGGPILVIGLSALDAMKAISSFKEDENKKFYKNLKVRLICLALLILTPTIIDFLVKLFISGSCEFNMFTK